MIKLKALTLGGCFRFIRVMVLATALSCAAALPALAEEVTAPLVTREYKDTTTVNHPVWVEPLENGNYLVSRVGFQQPSVQEVGPAGEVVWTFKGVQPANAKRLANGNTLIADSGVPGPPYAPRVVEITPAGKTVWEHKFSSLAEAPRYAERLAGGNTLITLPFKIIEVNSSGKIVWSYGSGKPVLPGSPGYFERPVMATELPGGNLLVVDKGFYGGRVFEIDKQSKSTVWQFGQKPAELAAAEQNGEAAPKPITSNPKFLLNPSSACRVGDRTLITDLGTHRLLEINAKGELVSKADWSPALENYPVMNIWQAVPSSDKLLLVLTLSNSNSRVIEVNTRMFSPATVNMN